MLCNPFGVYEWRGLRMGVKVACQAFQRMVANCICSHGPHSPPCIDNILTGARLVSRGKGKVLDSQPYDEHGQRVYRLFEALGASHLHIKLEECHLFMERVKHRGHVLEAGTRPAPPLGNGGPLRHGMVSMT